MKPSHSFRQEHFGDGVLHAADLALRTLWATPHSRRPMPAPLGDEQAMNEAQRSESAALMRVNHVGEVCAQALYAGQALGTRSAALRHQLEHAGSEETDHLAWTASRIRALGGRTSWLNPLWFAGSFCLGYAAARLGGDQHSLGFVVETEKQVEAHLRDHMTSLPVQDTASRGVVQAMMADEVRHAREAQSAGAQELSEPIKRAMQLAAKVMTRVAHRV